MASSSTISSSLLSNEPMFAEFFDSVVACVTGGTGPNSNDRRSERNHNSTPNTNNNSNSMTLHSLSTAPVQHLSLRIPRQISMTTTTSHDVPSSNMWWCVCMVLFIMQCTSHHHLIQVVADLERGIKTYAIPSSTRIQFGLASMRCDTFQFQEKIRFGLWQIENINDGTCSSWKTADAWVVCGRVASVIGHVFGMSIIIYLGLLFWSCCSSHRSAVFLKQKMTSSLVSFAILGCGIAIGMIGTISLATTIVRSDMCLGQCSVRFSGLYCSTILWVATGFSLLLVPLCTPSPEEDMVSIDKSAWKSRNKHSGSATSNEDHGYDSTDLHQEELGFAIVKRFNNGETHITETINEPDGTIRRTQIVKSPNGSEQVVAKIYDEDGSFVSSDDEEPAALQVANEHQNRIADNENVVKILLSDSPEDIRPISTTIHWGVPSSHRMQPVTYFQEPPLQQETPAPLAFSQSTMSQSTMSFFPCQVPDILNDTVKRDEDDASLENGSIPSIIAFNKLSHVGDDQTDSSAYGPRVLKAKGRQDVV